MANKLHCYCAICGAPTGHIKWKGGNPRAYDRRVVTAGKVDWLTEVELLCQSMNPQK